MGDAFSPLAVLLAGTVAAHVTAGGPVELPKSRGTLRSVLFTRL